MRTDAGARKIVERLDSLKQETDGLQEEVRDIAVSLAGLQGKVEQSVTWPKLVAILGGFAAAVITTAWLIVSASLARSENTVAAVQKTLADDIRQIRSDTTVRLDRFEAKQDAILRVTLDGKSRAVAKKELERRTGETRTDSN